MQIDFYLTTTNIPIFFNIDLGELHQKKNHQPHFKQQIKKDKIAFSSIELLVLQM